jgi:hypothetical protein
LAIPRKHRPIAITLLISQGANEYNPKTSMYLCRMNYRVFFCWLLLLVCTDLAAQSSLNPFELRHRLPKTTVSGRAMPVSVNPFDVVPHRSPGASLAPVQVIDTPSNPFSILPKGNKMAESTLFWVLMLLLGLTTFTVASNRKIVSKAWRGFLNESSLTLAQREAFGLIGSTPYYLLYLHFLLQAGVFIFLVTRFFAPQQFNHFPYLLVCLLISASIFLTKHVLLGLTAWLYPVGESIGRYNFMMIIFNCILGLFLVPFNLLIAFSSDLRGFMVFWSLGLVAIFYIYRTFRASSIGFKYLIEDQFHFLLYLCTVEIAPVMFLVKLALDQAK